LAEAPVESVPSARKRRFRLQGYPLAEEARPEQLRALREAAARQEANAARISATIYEALRTEIPTYGAIGDPEMIADVQSVSAALVTIWLRAIKTGEFDEDDLAPVRYGARRRARQGLDLQSLLKAFRVAIRVMWRQLLSSPEWQSPELAPLLPLLAEWALEFSDAMATEVDSNYLDEQRRLDGEAELRRSALLELVLAGRAERAPLELMPELRRLHVVVVAEISDDVAIDRLDRVGSVLERHAQAKLWTVRHRSVVAVLRRSHAEKRTATLQLLESLVGSEPIVARIGLGGDSDGPDGTASSYAEAHDALRLGRLLFGDSRRVHDFTSLGQYSFALSDPAGARRWADSVLAERAAGLTKQWSFPTLESYLVQRGNLKLVAHELGVHVNTVKYRLAILRQLVGSRIDSGELAMELLLALRLKKVLSASSAP
jgi:DNA-binding PucR family transcriptional regulator